MENVLLLLQSLFISFSEPDIFMVDVTLDDEPAKVERLSGHKQPVNRLAFHPTAPILVSSSSDGIKVWTKGTSGWLLTKSLLDIDISSLEWADICWHPSGSHFIVCCRNGDVQFIKKDSWEVTFVLNHLEDISKAVFSPNGVFLAVVGFNRLLSLWNLEKDRSKPIYRFFVLI